ncbi:MAG: class I SAM-dependent methyltransferase [Candidatus Poribacteria bacterium]|nr:class I SAM-dependent methyltransferase [Candidatus Poribacteria bacterium]
MSYIHRPYDNYYEPGESLKNLFGELVVQPFEHDLPALAEDVRNTKIYYWEDIARILSQGQSDFDDVSFDKASSEYYFPKDKVSIYCVHHMPRHLFGSYHIFTNCLAPINEKNKVVFIDFGCGPLTSGIAFRAFAGESDITYLGIDSSQTMLDKAASINKYGPNRYKEPFYGKFELVRECDGLTRLLDKYIENGNVTQIIFNFCYFFSSPTLDIKNLSEAIIQIMKEYNQHKMCFVYQNPDHRSLSKSGRLKTYGKWEKLKTNLSMIRSQITQSDVETFSYCRLINGSLHDNAKVYYEILCDA